MGGKISINGQLKYDHGSPTEVDSEILKGHDPYDFAPRPPRSSGFGPSEMALSPLTFLWWELSVLSSCPKLSPRLMKSKVQK